MRSYNNVPLITFYRSKFRRIFCLSADSDDEERIFESNNTNSEATGSSQRQNNPEVGHSSSQSKKSVKSSIATEFFEDYTLTHKRCKDCGKLLKICGNATNFISHAKSQHPIRYHAVKMKYAVSTESQGEIENQNVDDIGDITNNFVDNAEIFHQKNATTTSSKFDI